jgi:hypothetical protein
MSTVLDLDQVTMRARRQEPATLALEYDLLDPAGAVLGSAVQLGGSPAAALRRWTARPGAALPADYELRDGSGAVLAQVSRRPDGLLRRRMRAEVRLPGADVVAVASFSVGARSFAVHDPAGTPLAQLARAGRTLFAVTGPHREQYGTVALEANTLTTRRAGTAHPHSYRVSFDPGAPRPVRIATLALVVVFDSLRGGT